MDSRAAIRRGRRSSAPESASVKTESIADVERFLEGQNERAADRETTETDRELGAVVGVNPAVSSG